MTEDLNQRAMNKAAGALGSTLAAGAVVALGPVGAALLAVGGLAAFEVAYQRDKRKQSIEDKK